MTLRDALTGLLNGNDATLDVDADGVETGGLLLSLVVTSYGSASVLVALTPDEFFQHPPQFLQTVAVPMVTAMMTRVSALAPPGLDDSPRILIAH